MSQNLWATIMSFGPVTNILLAQNFFFRAANRLALISGTVSSIESSKLFKPETSNQPDQETCTLKCHYL